MILIFKPLDPYDSEISQWYDDVDISANGQYSPAMKYYMEAGVVASDFFSSAVPKSIYDEQVSQICYIWQADLYVTEIYWL